MHIAFNGWFWDQPHTGSGQYLRHLLAALHQRAPEHRLTLVIPARVTTLEALPPQVDVLPMPPLGRSPCKVWFERPVPAPSPACARTSPTPYWGRRCASPARWSAPSDDPLLVPEYNAGLGNRLYTSLVRVGAARIAC